MVVKLRNFVLTCLCCAIFACQDTPGKKEFLQIEQIPDQKDNERTLKFSSYPVDRQIDIFLVSEISLAGKRDTYLRYLAKDGSSKVMSIAERLSVEQRASFRTSLIKALDLIDMECNCVHNDAVIMSIIETNNVVVVDPDKPDDRMSKQTYEQYAQRLKSRLRQ